MASIWTKLLRGCVDFLEKRGEALLGGSFASPKALLDALIAGAQDDRKPALIALRDTLGDGSGLTGADKTLYDKITTNLATARTELDKVKALLAAADFGMSEAKDSAKAIGKFVEGAQDSIGKIATRVAAGNAMVENQVNSIMEPWAAGLRDLGGNAPAAFDSFCKAVLDIDQASGGLWKALELDIAQGRLKVHLAEAGNASLGPVSFDGAEVEAFVQFKDPVLVGISLNSKIKAGLKADPMMARIVPGQQTADTDAVALQLDSDAGFSLGSGKNQRVVLPVRFAYPFVELRELALSTPNAGDDDKPAQLDLTVVVAGRIGSVLGVICEGGGVSFIDADGSGFTAHPRQPDGLGIKVKAGPVDGGGYLRKQGSEYGGAFQLKFAGVGVTAVGLLAPDTMALLIVIGVHFPAPGVQIGFGFSINAVGGLLASERRLDTGQLSAKLKDGAVSNILLPDDPVASAPKILDQLAAVFPAQPGAFVVGPIVEIGWGGKSGLVTARVGVLIAMPDPSVTILGSLAVMVPPKIAEGASFRVVELNVDLFAIISPDEFFMKATLRNSKIAGMAISGDLALLIRWASDSAFAISAGGFFPRYAYPPKLGGLQRLQIKIDPGLSWLKLSVTGYVAVTGNSVQFGGALDLVAKVGPASGEAHLSLDAMFVWAPRFAFIVEFNASVAIKAFGHSVAGAAFRGTLSGTAPWHVDAQASISILWWDVDFDVGPIEWGNRDVSVLPLIDSLGEVMKALADDTAWSALAPAAGDSVTIARVGDDMAGLLQPFSLIEAKQQIAPFDVDIARLGAYKSTVRQFNFANPKINNAAAPSFSTVQAPFAMGQFKEMSQDEKASKPDFEDHPAGIQISPVAGVQAGATAAATLRWDTFFPPEPQLATRAPWLIGAALNRTLVGAGAAAKARRLSANPYAPVTPGPVKMADAGARTVVPIATVGATTGAAASRAMTNTEAEMLANKAVAAGEQVQIVAMGLAA